LEKAQLLQKHNDKTRVLDVSEEATHPEEKSARIKKLGSEVAVKSGDTCFVVQPFAAPHGEYYEKIFKPAIEKTKLQAVRADAEIFGTGKIIDQVWRGFVTSFFSRREWNRLLLEFFVSEDISSVKKS
jgi:hypothetical protein